MRISRLYPLNSAFYWVSGSGVFALFALFLSTMASTVYFEDSGLFAMVCYHWGVAHPPMYPLYTLLCPSFAHLPLISPIHGIAIFSALNAVVACFFIAVIIMRLSGQVIAAVIAALIYGLSDSLWAQAVIQEVYTLNSLLFFAALWRTIEFAYRPNARNFHWMIFLSLLGLSNHWPLMMLSAIGFPFIIFPVWREFLNLWWSRQGIFAMLFAILALSPYAIMWLRSLADPLISFYGPIDNWSLFWFIITRQGYAGVDNAGGNWIDKTDYLHWLFASMVNEQITWMGLFFVVLGFIFLWRCGKWLLSMGLLLAVLGGSVCLVMLLDFKFNDFSRSIFRVYPLVSWGILSLLVGLGIAYVTQWVRYFSKVKNLHSLIWQVTPVFFLVIPLLLLLQNYHNNKHPHITWAHQWAMTILNSLEKNAVLFTHDDTHLPLMYLHAVEGIREDISIYNTQSLIFNNRLTKARLSSKIKSEHYLSLARDTSRPFYTFYESENPYGSYWNGVYFQADKNLNKGDKINRLDPVFYDTLITGMDGFKDRNGWSRNQKFKMGYQLSTLLLEMPIDTPHHQNARATLLSAPFGKYAYASAWFEHRLPSSEESLAFKLMETIDPLVQFLPPYQQARHYNIYGRVHSVRANKRDYKMVENILLKGVQSYDWNDNPATYTLLELYAQTQNKADFDYYDKLYPNAGRDSGIIKAYRQGENYTIPPIISPEKAKQMLHQAITYLQNKPQNPDEALRIATDLEKFYAHEVSVHFLIGGARMMRKEFNLAEKAFLRALELNPNHLDSKVNLLSIYLNTKKYDPFQQHLEEALNQYPQEKRLLTLKNYWEKNQAKLAP